jgi:hypothetical protein
MIIEFTISHVLLDVNGKKVEIGGDLITTPENKKGFDTSLRQELYWTDGSLISISELKTIEDTLKKDFLEHGWILYLRT